MALLMGNRPEWAVAWLAAGLVGAVLVPVNTFAPPGELDWILRHGDASLLLLQPALGGHRYREELLARHPEIAAAAPGRIRCPALPQLRRVACLGLTATQGGVESWASFLAEGAGVSEALLGAVAAEVFPSDDALIIYTSGTTERPKGIVHSQRAPVIQSLALRRVHGPRRPRTASSPRSPSSGPPASRCPSARASRPAPASCSRRCSSPAAPSS